MNCIRRAVALSACSIFLAACQHIPRAPLNLETINSELSAREVAVEPVRAYAARLAACQSEPPPEFNAEDGVSLHEAEAVALWYNAEVRVARLEAERAAAVAGNSPLAADPQLGYETGEKSVESGLGPLGGAGGVERSWIHAGSLSLTLPLSGRPWAERRVLSEAAAVAQIAAERAEWELLKNLRGAWLEWSAEEEHLRLLDEHLAALGEFTVAAEALASVGELPPTNARLFTLEQARRAAEREQRVHEAARLRAHLLHLMGLAPDAPATLLPSLVVQSPAPGQATTPDVGFHPAVAQARAEYEQAEAQLRLELRRQYPDITISPVYTDEQDETSLTLGVGLPVPVWDANRRGIADAASARDVARGRVVAAVEAARAAISQAEAAHTGAAARRTRLEQDVAPLVDEQLAQSRALLAAGELDLLPIHEALTQALAIKEELLEARQNEQAALVELMALIRPHLSEAIEERNAS